MPIQALFEAFTGLAAILASAVVASLFLCTRDIDQEEHREWTLRPRPRRH